MGPDSDPYAVVDPTLRVYGVQGLRVIDASIMPRITSGNINAPVIMIGEKGADMIKEYWSGAEALKKRKRTPAPLPYAHLVQPQTGVPAPSVKPLGGVQPQGDYRQHVMDTYSDFFNRPLNQTIAGFGQLNGENYERVLYDNVGGTPANAWPQQRTNSLDRADVPNATEIEYDDDEYLKVEDVNEFDSNNSGQFARRGVNTDVGSSGGQYGGFSTNENGTRDVERREAPNVHSRDKTSSGGKLRYSEILGTSYQGEMMKMMKQEGNS